ncbi:hypothetical protein FZ934_20840 (plasmid) [Rhizobium grahamii]|uniref:TPM domain-containing protein n=1 Tax=Rhizobium grahamii TaxID=1120045 RepID=A0A5Q0CE90_9HYPH|nr:MULTISPECIES: hypothetical protein [Rhizobium]QFY62804.1 hypothetical protein FZ934_20840 [Rhizobium grahamii]QRM52449.1 hypothetical protein F3Y33_24815 [Rhizobium sp. BG6]
MRTLWIIAALLCVAAAIAVAFFAGADTLTLLCNPSESCAREWIAATSGWAAVLAAVPTILYLSRQVRDADLHQRTGFAIQLRKHRILAARTARIAYVVLGEMDKEEKTHAETDMRYWDKEMINGLLHHLRDGTISAFESEIAHPISIGGWGLAMIIERGYAGIEPALQSAPQTARAYFENLRDQAEAYLSEVAEITKHP